MINEEQKEMTQNEKILFIVERAMKTHDSTLLFKASTLLEMLARFEAKYNEIINS